MSVGQVLNDRYRLDSVLGQGGMGVVWLGLDVLLGRPVAVKTLHGETSRAADRFLREARTLAALRSPGVVRILDFGTSADGTVFMVMEYVEGLTLAGRLTGGPLGEAETLALVTAVARSLGVVHAEGIVHRDVKPANIMLNPDGSVVLVDFGIAVPPEGPRITQSGALVGTPTYLAPEQANGAPVTPAADLYALGVVAYECLTGRPPFDGPTPMAIVSQHLTAPPPPLPPGVSPATAALVGRALAKAPADRWPDALAMVQAASHHPAARPSIVPSLIAQPSATLPSQRPAPSKTVENKRLAFLAGVTAVAAFAGAAALVLPGLFSGSDEETSPPSQLQAAPATPPAAQPSASAEPPADASPPVADAAAWWQFNAADSLAPTLEGNAKLEADAEHDGVLALDGLSGHAKAAVPALNPAKAFTVAVWVRFSGYGDAEPRDVTVASVPGRNVSAFFLQYKATWGSNGWHFLMPRADSPEPEVDAASSAIRPEQDRWYFVAGVHDPAAQRISLYIDGELQTSARHAANWKTTKPLRLGMHLWSRKEGGHWPGGLDKAAVYNRALTPAEIKALASW